MSASGALLWPSPGDTELVTAGEAAKQEEKEEGWAGGEVGGRGGGEGAGGAGRCLA